MTGFNECKAKEQPKAIVFFTADPNPQVAHNVCAKKQRKKLVEKLSACPWSLNWHGWFATINSGMVNRPHWQRLWGRAKSVHKTYLGKSAAPRKVPCATSTSLLRLHQHGRLATITSGWTNGLGVGRSCLWCISQCDWRGSCWELLEYGRKEDPSPPGRPKVSTCATRLSVGATPLPINARIASYKSVLAVLLCGFYLQKCLSVMDWISWKFPLFPQQGNKIHLMQLDRCGLLFNIITTSKSMIWSMLNSHYFPSENSEAAAYHLLSFFSQHHCFLSHWHL